MKMSDFERIRLVLLGGAGVGKSSVVKRFLTKTYCDKYRPTVEDLHNREYDLGSVSLKVKNSKPLFDTLMNKLLSKVDILDTSGDLQFPAMRRLSIATAHAFLLVYSVTSAPSLIEVKQCFEEIREQRADFQVKVIARLRTQNYKGKTSRKQTSSIRIDCVLLYRKFPSSLLEISPIW